jgi:hypothetical protein
VVSRVIDGFLPSRNGFRFANRWPSGPTVKLGAIDPRWFFGVGDAAQGLCGGMALSARDMFENGLIAPTDTEPFANGSARFQQIVRRQVQSLDWGLVPFRYWELAAFRPDPPTTVSRLLRREPPRVPAIRREWPRIRAELDAGRLAVVGLIRHAGANPLQLTQNHQTLAFAYDETAERITIRIYDPNHPGDDTVELRAAVTPDVDRPWRDRIRLEQSTGEPLLGFFLHPYPRPGSLKAWR